ncbi:hypothetical protein GSbR_18640 [Geobacter sp. SVR]|nr:hypothetical protein GSVR_33900 [Geobacter sp. SVR]GCF85264.1 hypothetical protein GSbR_18640 [Geobacter sp. SVR]
MSAENVEYFTAHLAALMAQLVIHPDSLAAGVDPAAAFEVGQMPRHSGLWKFQDGHQVADAQLSFGFQKKDNAQSNRICQGLEYLGVAFHGIDL